MNRIISITLCSLSLLISFNATAQKKADAAALYESVRGELADMTAAKFSFTFSATDSDNELLVKLDGEFIGEGDRFKLVTPAMEVYCDGESKWIYDSFGDELMIFPHDAASTDIAENPFAVLSSTGSQAFEFKNKVEDGIIHDQSVSIITMTPKQPNAAYQSVRISISQKKGLPLAIEYITTSGDTYTVLILSTTEIPSSPASFYTPSQDLLNNPDIYVTDMR